MQLHLDGVVEEGSMHGLSDDVHPSEGEGEVGQAAADPRARQILLRTYRTLTQRSFSQNRFINDPSDRPLFSGWL